ncbi:glycosyltransferase family 4 protein [Candidatus Sumerlaeota bacterium]|nr:glycosyltransferase family 4 protein [Candidatus Sumerlaeota bacterium]
MSITGSLARAVRPLRHVLPLRWRWWIKHWIRHHTRQTSLLGRLLTWFTGAASPAPGRGLSLAAADADRWRELLVDPPPTTDLRSDPQRRICLFLVDTLSYSGAPRVLLNMAEALPAESGWRFLALKVKPLDWTDQGDTTALFERSGVRCLQAIGGVQAPHVAALVTGLCCDLGIDAVLINGCTLAYEALAEIRSAPPHLLILNQIHTEGPLSHTPLSIQQDRHIDLHIPIQSRIAETLRQEGVDPAKIQVIHNGIDMEGGFNPERFERAASAGAPLLLFPARLHPGKRPLEFLRLIKALRVEIPGVRGLIVGDGEMMRDVERFIARHGLGGCVERLDPVSEMGPLYARADVTVMTSVVEGLPLTILESLAMGVPVLTTDVGDVRAAVRDGETGFIVPVGDRRALIDRAREMLTDPDLLRRMHSAARPSVRNQFDRRRMVDDYLALLSCSVARE